LRFKAGVKGVIFMPVVYCGICPHPPIVVPEVGAHEADKVDGTQQALLELGKRVKKSGAESIVIISPHSPVFRDAVGIRVAPRLQGHLGQFGAAQVSFDVANDLPLAGEIKQQLAEQGLSVVELTEELAGQYRLSLQLDHGITVPLYFLQKAGLDLPLVAVSMAMLPVEKLYLFGLAVRKASDLLNRKVALLASGDLSHSLKPGAPGGYEPRGEEFDREVVRLVAEADAEGLIDLDPGLVEQAGECGYRSIIMMMGALDGLAVNAEVLSYEGPFGVGYLVAAFAPGRLEPGKSLLAGLELQHEEDMRKQRAGESYLVGMARQSLENYLQHGKMLSVPDEVPPEFRGEAAAFVSIKKHGQLRGCIGTVAPTRRNVVEEIVVNAISAGTRDPRFFPVQVNELEDLVYSVDVLQPPEPVEGLDDLNPKKYGVIVRAGRRSGLLLPDLEGVDTPAEQVAIARQKAGIGPHEPVELERFEVKRYK